MYVPCSPPGTFCDGAVPDSFVSQMRNSLWYRQFRLYLCRTHQQEYVEEWALKMAYSSCDAISCSASRGDE